MKRILVVFTGGTIGSRIRNSTIDVDENESYYLIETFKMQTGHSVEFDTIQPMNILSENATPKHWQMLFASIKQIDFTAYDGIIVTHGSDTLPYTCAAFGYLLSHTQIPVVFTASNYALEVEGSNGMDNFKSSVEFIMNTPIPGVFAVFQNDKGMNIVYLATRLMEADHYKDQFSGFGGDYLGEIKNGVFRAKKSKLNPTLQQLRSRREKLIEGIAFNNDILAIRSYPGLKYSHYDLSQKPKAVLHDLYHSGTGCTNPNDYSITEFVKHCKQEGIDSYLISFKNVNGDLYKTSRELLDNGAYPLQNISFEAAYVKLCIAYNQTVSPPREYMDREVYFEFLHDGKNR